MENYQNYNKNDDWKEREFMKGDGRLSGPRKSYKESSPEEVKEAVKEQVSKGVAAAAGAVEGFAEEMENDKVAETAGKAIELAGDTTRTIAKTTVEQLKRTKDAITGSDLVDSGLSGIGSDSGSLGKSKDSGLGSMESSSYNDEDSDLDDLA